MAGPWEKYRDEKPWEKPRELPEGGPIEGAVGAGINIAGQMANQMYKGLMGAAKVAQDDGNTERASEYIQQANWLSSSAVPDSQKEKLYQENITKGFEFLTNVIPAGYAGIAQSVMKMDINAGAEKIDQVLDEGIGPTLGEGALSAVEDSNLPKEVKAGVATAAFIAPDILESIFGFKGGKAAIKDGGPAAFLAADTTIKGVDDLLKRVLKTPDIQMVDDAGKITPAAMEKIDELAQTEGLDVAELDRVVAEQLVNEGIITPEAAQRFNLMVKRDVTPRLADVTQKRSDQMEQNEIIKESNELSEITAQQDAELIAAAKEGRVSMGGVTTSHPATNNNLFSVVDKTVGDAELKVNEAYAAARESVPDEEIVDLSGFYDALESNKGNESATGGLISSARQELRNRDFLDDSDQPQPQLVTVAEAEKIRQAVSATAFQLSKSNGAASKVGRDLKDAIDQDVDDATGGRFFDEARQSRIDLDRLVRRAKRDSRDKTGKTFLEKVLDNTIPQEDIFKKLMNGRDDDFAFMKNFLLNESGPEGIQAWQNIKGQLFYDGLEKAVKFGKTEGGGREFNGERFADHFKNLKADSEKYGMVFDEAEIELINDLSEIHFIRKGSYGNAQGKGPSAQGVAGAVKDLTEAKLLSNSEAGVIQNVLSMIPVAGRFVNAKAMKERAVKRAEFNLGTAKREAIERHTKPLGETKKAIDTLEKVDRKRRKK